MYLKDNELKSGFIENTLDENFGNIGYDLRIAEIVKDSERTKDYELQPAESVFVSTKEVINIPTDMFAQVVIRNSAIRLGLSVVAPIYQPGHKTRIFFRVTNSSARTVHLEEGKSICTLMAFRFATASDKPYTGVYSDEMDYRGIGDFHSVSIPEAGSLTEKLKAVEKVESRLYGNVMMMLTVFVAIFSLVNLNTAAWQNDYSLSQTVMFNFMFLSVISTLVLLVAEVLNRLTGRRWLYAVPILALLLSLLAQWAR